MHKKVCLNLSKILVFWLESKIDFGKNGFEWLCFGFVFIFWFNHEFTRMDTKFNHGFTRINTNFGQGGHRAPFRVIRSSTEYCVFKISFPAPYCLNVPIFSSSKHLCFDAYYTIILSKIKRFLSQHSALSSQHSGHRGRGEFYSFLVAFLKIAG